MNQADYDNYIISRRFLAAGLISPLEEVMVCGALLFLFHLAHLFVYHQEAMQDARAEHGTDLQAQQQAYYAQAQEEDQEAEGEG